MVDLRFIVLPLLIRPTLWFPFIVAIPRCTVTTEACDSRGEGHSQILHMYCAIHSHARRIFQVEPIFAFRHRVEISVVDIYDFQDFPAVAL